MIYHFQKLYADLVSDDATVCIVYFAQTTLLGTKYAHAGVEVYWPDGRREVNRAQVPIVSSPFEQLDQLPQLRIDMADCSLILDFDVKHGAWKPASFPRSDLLGWKIEIAQAQVRARWLGDPGRACLQGAGYIDCVELKRIPRRLGIKRIDWGRIHWPHQTYVFNAISFHTGPPWKSVVCWSQDSGFSVENQFNLEETGEGMRLVLQNKTISFQLVRVLHDGPVVDPLRFPNLMERLAARAVAGPIRETRWLSHVHETPALEVGLGWAVHERIYFNTPGQASFFMPGKSSREASNATQG